VNADAVVAALGLAAHPEGGWYRETFRHEPDGGGRGAMTAIYCLLKAGERSHWHRVDAAEIWHWYAGAPLALSTPGARRILGPDLAAGERPQLTIAKDEWQSAESLGAWTLVGCTVGPAFVFEGFELAAKGWSPA